ncbi:M20 family metallo-hydrolase [Bacillus sp. B15-48]|uniref:M20 family metallo-hydrolase n=1 Tax=Bacillus sp. B15-48 TaxID=1548601 RepID=UPI00193FAD6C|nr:M20 family metallo-hydrolase [Bacillus sp. B15-48]MBM4761375.1 hydantoinase/carbamoylase family amidase [Bacillus sp. B15-48]
MTNATDKIYQKLLENYDSDRLDLAGVSGKRLASRMKEIAEIGLTSDGGSHRIGFSKEEQQAKKRIIQWMEQAGLTVTQDGAGNVFGRIEGRNPGLPALMSGSHVDTVPNGGHFDGVLGVLVALEVAAAWKESNYIPDHPYEVVIFTDEEGSRFNDGFTGSRAAFGLATAEEQLKLADDQGMQFAQVLEDNGLTTEQFFTAKRNVADIKAFIEVHIEQGLQLEKENLPVGIVSGIAGPCWLEITYTGVASHAGNTPMNLRSDALVAAGELISHIPPLPSQVSSTAVATVGKIEVKPNGINVIPGEVTLFVDIRDIQLKTRDEVITKVIDLANKIAHKYQLDYQWKELLKVEPVPLPDEIVTRVTAAADANGIKPYLLPSGAGHDAMIAGQFVPTGMIFVRSKDGLSHNPLEWSSLNDCVQSVHVLKHVLESYKA